MEDYFYRIAKAGVLHSRGVMGLTPFPNCSCYVISYEHVNVVNGYEGVACIVAMSSLVHSGNYSFQTSQVPTAAVRAWLHAYT